MEQGVKISIYKCYSLAWKSFSKWWIPLCLISGIIFIFQIVPSMLMRADLSEYTKTTTALVTAISEGDEYRIMELSPVIAAQADIFLQKIARFILFFFPFIALFTVILLMYANWAVKNKKDNKRPFHILAYIAFVHVILALIKIFAFFLFIIPGVYLYIKLLFVSLVMLEEGKGVIGAIKGSWRMTRGHFWKLLWLVSLNSTIQLISMPTVIGVIPSTGFTNTARAAAFRMLLERNDYK